MSNDKPKVADKAGEIAKNIWLAGVGAYGRAVDEAQGRLEKVGVDTPKIFRELVKAGAALEEEARDALGPIRSGKSSMEERINRVRENFNLQRPGKGDDLASLHAKIDLLSNKLDILTVALTEQGSRKPTKARKKVTPRKTAANKPAAKTKRSTAKKSIARKRPS